MNEVELKQARKDYRAKIKENKKNEEINREIEELKKTKEVLRYIELTKNIEKQILNEEEIIQESFKKIATTKDSNNIYVFMGSYIKHFAPAADTLSPIKNASWVDYNIYWNLETEQAIKIMKENINCFEKNNIVIDNKISSLSANFSEYHKNFIKIQNRYYKNLTYTTIEKSIARIKKIYK